VIETIVNRKFGVNGLPLLASGQSTQPLAAAEHLWLHSKVYSRGGENALHAHVTEDHAFFVLNGAAEFTFGDGDIVVAERYEGVMVAKGTPYRFEARGDENLIMLRMGAAVEATPYVKASFGLTPVTSAPGVAVVDANGESIVDVTSRSKGKTPSEPVVVIPGRTFPEDKNV
jgi:mannose-6-phosphate isomerase-like protein (cupin superfamily)